MIKLTNALLRAPRVFVQIALFTLVTAIVTYVYTGSFLRAILYGGLALVLQQFGYIGGILFLAWREHNRRRRR